LDFHMSGFFLSYASHFPCLLFRMFLVALPPYSFLYSLHTLLCSLAYYPALFLLCWSLSVSPHLLICWFSCLLGYFLPEVKCTWDLFLFPFVSLVIRRLLGT
jgi:hypothetical protein